MTAPDRDLDDVLAIAQRALQKVNELEGRVDELEQDVTKQSLRLSEIDDGRSYETLSRDAKVGMVREHAFEKACDRGGRTKLYYDDVRWGVFDGEPGTKHCYTLLQLAAGLSGEERTGGEFPGFECKDPDGDNYHLRVNAEQAKEFGLLFPENKTDPAEVRSE